MGLTPLINSVSRFHQACPELRLLDYSGAFLVNSINHHVLPLAFFFSLDGTSIVSPFSLSNLSLVQVLHGYLLRGLLLGGPRLIAEASWKSKELKGWGWGML